MKLSSKSPDLRGFLTYHKQTQPRRTNEHNRSENNNKQITFISCLSCNIFTMCFQTIPYDCSNEFRYGKTAYTRIKLFVFPLIENVCRSNRTIRVHCRVRNEPKSGELVSRLLSLGRLFVPFARLSVFGDQPTCFINGGRPRERVRGSVP